MIDHLTSTQSRLWAIFHGTVPNWPTLVRPGNEISYITGKDYPPKVLMGSKAPGDYAEFSICPLSFIDQGWRSKGADTFGAAQGVACAFTTEEQVPYELKLSFGGLRYEKAGALVVAMKSALYAAGPHLALVAPASPTAAGLPYVRSWGGWSGTFRQEPNEGGSLRLVVRTNLTVSYRFTNTDFGL